MHEPTPVFRHVLLTRFNTRTGPATAAPGESWMRDRWTLFQRFTERSVAGQTCRDFTWLVFFDASTPETWRARIDAAAARTGFRPVYLDVPFSAHVAAGTVSALDADDAPFLITTRLDNDDALAPHFVEAVHHAFRPQVLQFLNFPVGYQISGTKVFLRASVANSFASLIERVGRDPVRTVYFTGHHLIGRHPVRQVWGPPAWLQVLHEDNLANEVRGIPVSGQDAVRRFALDDARVDRPGLSRQVTACAGLVARSVADPQALARVARLFHRPDRPGGPHGPSHDDDPPADAEPPVITAILTCHNRRDLTLAALGGWFAQRDHGAVLRAVVVDDGSTDGTAEAVRASYPGVRLLRGAGSLFWAGGMAAAEAEALRSDPDAVVWLNDDVVLAEGALRCLLRVSRASSPPAVVAGSLRDPNDDEPTYGAVSVGRWHPLRVRAVPPTGTACRVDAMNGNVVLVPRSAYRSATSVDGGFAHAYADFDYALRLRRMNYPVLLAPGTVGWCSRATSSRGGRSSDIPLMERWRLLNSPRGVPLGSQVRYLRRHAGPWWPALVVSPYVKEAVRGIRLGRPARGARTVNRTPGPADGGPAHGRG